MIEAYKDGKTVLIPADTYKRIYKPNGWQARRTRQKTTPSVKPTAQKPAAAEMASLKKRAKKAGIDISDANSAEEALEIIEKAENL